MRANARNVPCLSPSVGVDESMRRRGYFDEAKAEQAVRFVRSLKHTKGRWAGVPFNLQPFQEKRIREIFGRLNADGTRQYRIVYLEEPRKNGKSEEAAAGLKLLAADGEMGAEVYGAAYSREQAGIVYRVAAGMTRQSPSLRSRLKVIDSTKRIIFPKTDSFYWAIPAETAQAHGFNMHGGIFDEFHVQRTRDLYDVLLTSMGSRIQPLLYMITTAGYDRQSICWELHQYAEQVISGAIEDPSFYAEIWSAPVEADWTDEEVWKACNPALGIFRNIEEMRQHCERAKQMPAAENTFRRLYLNQWVQQSIRWIAMETWHRNAGAIVNEPDIVACGFYGLLDLSAVSDLTAWVMLFPQAEDPERVDVVARFWCPKARLIDPFNPYRAQYQAWERDGFLTATEGNAIDYAFVKRQVIEDSTRFGLKRMNIDRLFQGAQLGMELAEELGAERVLAMGMGHMAFAAPMVEFERRLLAGKINHQGNPVLAWMADNVVVKTDPQGNMKPDKAASQGKIDGIVGIVGAIEAQMRYDGAGSVYEERGLTVFG